MGLNKQIEEIKKRNEAFTSFNDGFQKGEHFVESNFEVLYDIFKQPIFKDVNASIEALENATAIAKQSAFNGNDKNVSEAMHHASRASSIINQWTNNIYDNLYGSSNNFYGASNSVYGGDWVGGHYTKILRPLLSYDFLKEVENNSEEVDPENKQPDIKIHPINEKLYAFLSENPRLIYEVPPRRFEEIIAGVLENMGYKIELTPETRDGGRDIVLYKKLHALEFSGIVECKRYAPHNKVPISEIRNFIYTVISAEKKNIGLFVTSSFYTKGAYELPEVKSKLVQLNDFNNISKWFTEYKK